MPAAFSGSWAGQARQVNPPDEFHVRLTLPAGAADGSVAYSNASISCVGQLSPDSFAGGTLTLDQGITVGPAHLRRRHGDADRRAGRDADVQLPRQEGPGRYRHADPS